MHNLVSSNMPPSKACLEGWVGNLGLKDAAKASVYQQRGQDPERVAAALRKPCCVQKCKRKLTVKMALSMCIAFWSLTKQAQDGLPLVL